MAVHSNFSLREQQAKQIAIIGWHIVNQEKACQNAPLIAVNNFLCLTGCNQSFGSFRIAKDFKIDVIYIYFENFGKVPLLPHYIRPRIQRWIH